MEDIKLKYIITISTLLNFFLLVAIVIFQIVGLGGRSEFGADKMESVHADLSISTDLNNQLEFMVSNILASRLDQFLVELQRNAVTVKSVSDAEQRYGSQANELSGMQVAQQEIIIAESQSIISQAISAGVWTAADSRKLSEHTHNLTENQRIQLLDELYSAINRQEVQLNDIPVF